MSAIATELALIKHRREMVEKQRRMLEECYWLERRQKRYNNIQEPFNQFDDGNVLDQRPSLRDKNSKGYQQRDDYYNKVSEHHVASKRQTYSNGCFSNRDYEMNLQQPISSDNGDRTSFNEKVNRPSELQRQQPHFTSVSEPSGVKDTMWFDRERAMKRKVVDDHVNKSKFSKKVRPGNTEPVWEGPVDVHRPRQVTPIWEGGAGSHGPCKVNPIWERDVNVGVHGPRNVKPIWEANVNVDVRGPHKVTPIWESNFDVDGHGPHKVTPIWESNVDVNVHGPRNVTPVWKEDVDVNVHRPHKVTPIWKGDVDVNVHRPRKVTPIWKGDVDVNVHRPHKVTPIWESNVDVDVHGPRNVTPIWKEDVDVNVHRPHKVTPIWESNVDVRGPHKVTPIWEEDVDVNVHRPRKVTSIRERDVDVNVHRPRKVTPIRERDVDVNVRRPRKVTPTWKGDVDDGSRCAAPIWKGNVSVRKPSQVVPISESGACVRAPPQNVQVVRDNAHVATRNQPNARVQSRIALCVEKILSEIRVNLEKSGLDIKLTAPLIKTVKEYIHNRINKMMAGKGVNSVSYVLYLYRRHHPAAKDVMFVKNLKARMERLATVRGGTGNFSGPVLESPTKDSVTQMPVGAADKTGDDSKSIPQPRELVAQKAETQRVTSEQLNELLFKLGDMVKAEAQTRDQEERNALKSPTDGEDQQTEDVEDGIDEEEGEGVAVETGEEEEYIDPSDEEEMDRLDLVIEKKLPFILLQFRNLFLAILNNEPIPKHYAEGYKKQYYKVKLVGEPTLPRWHFVMNFLMPYNVLNIRKLKMRGNIMLIIGCGTQEDRDRLLAASGSTVGNTKLLTTLWEDAHNRIQSGAATTNSKRSKDKTAAEIADHGQNYNSHGVIYYDDDDAQDDLGDSEDENGQAECEVVVKQKKNVEEAEPVVTRTGKVNLCQEVEKTVDWPSKGIRSRGAKRSRIRWNKDPILTSCTNDPNSQFYMVKVFGRPTLPKRSLLAYFLVPYNVMNIRRFGIKGNDFLVIVCRTKEDRDRLLDASGATIENSKLDIKMCDKMPNQMTSHEAATSSK